jgi:hypothetical protein
MDFAAKGTAPSDGTVNVQVRVNLAARLKTHKDTG